MTAEEQQQRQEAYEARFVEMVKQSWVKHEEHAYSQKVDDILAGAVIAGNVHNGFSLIDLSSDGRNHYLRFQNLANGDRLTFRLQHLTGPLEKSQALGHIANVTIGLGQPVDSISTLWSSFKQEMKSTFIVDKEPGIVTLDADLTAKYLYAQVSLIWDLNEYFTAPWKVDFQKLAMDIHCTNVSLKKYLNGRLNLQGAKG